MTSDASATTTQTAATPPVMRLRSDPNRDAALAMTGWAMATRLPRTLGAAAALGWAVDRAGVVMLLSCQVIGAVLAAAGLTATSGTLSAFLADAPAGHRLAGAAVPLAIVCVAVAGYGLANAGAQRAAARLTPRMLREADSRVLRAATAVELAAYDTAGFDDRLDAAGHGVEAIRDLVRDAELCTSAVAQMVAAATVATALHPLLLPLLLLSAAPRGVAAVRAARIDYAAFHRTLSDSRLRSVLRSYTSERRHAAEIRANTMARFLLGQYHAVAERLEREELDAARLALRVRTAGDALSGLALGFTWAALAGLVATGRVDLAVAGTAVVAVRATSTALTSLVRAGARVYRTSLALDDWNHFLRLADQHRIRRGSHRIDTAPDTVRATHLTYTYPGTARPAIDGVDLELRRGEVVALVGENGSGKTTLAKLVTGLLLPTSGTVLWGGRDITTVDPDYLWRNIGIVPQDYTRWPMAARENISLGQPHPDGDQAVHRAARAAGADTVLADLPHGLDTLLARSWWGGHELSGGQWQRLAIARAFHRDAPMLILDEPTAALDARAEHNVFTRLRALAAGRITLFVTHRLANTRLADRIVVLERGRIVEDGTFDDLVHAGGLFAELYKLQQDL